MRLRTDWPLFLTVVLMVCFGLLFVYSTSSVVAEESHGQASYYFLVRQAGAAVLALVFLVLLGMFDYRRLKSAVWVFVLLGFVVALLILVYFVDKGHHRWLDLGPFKVQPSELAKPVLIVFLAWFVTHQAQDINNRRTLFLATAALLILTGLVAVADLGTAVVLAGVAAVVFYIRGLKNRYCQVAVVAWGLIIAAAIIAVPFRLQRCLHMVDSEHKILDVIDPSGYIKAYAHKAMVTDTTYQQRQSRVAVGSGGLFGKGPMQGTQKLFYLPEAHTDFIYAIIGEEMGLFGCGLVLAGYLIILWRGLRSHLMALDEFGRYVAIGVTAAVVLQAFVNMSVVLGLGPTKGIPLPLISYGGSSMVSSGISLGLLLSVSQRAT